MKELLASDRGENSIMQVIAIPVSLLVSTMLSTGLFSIMSSGSEATAESVAQTKSLIGARLLDRELSEATEVVESSDRRVTVRNAEGDCVSFSLDFDADHDLNLVRTTGGCDGFLPTHDVLIERMGEASKFSYLNPGNVPLVDGAPVGECSPSYTAEECASKSVRIVNFDGVTLNPLTAENRMTVHALTSATMYELIQSPTAMDDVVITQTLPGDMSVEN